MTELLISISEIFINFVGFEVFTTVVMKSFITWDMTPCSPLGVNGLHGVTSQKMTLYIYQLNAYEILQEYFTPLGHNFMSKIKIISG
jgi:hypothetical protein